jgi:hypothetical protein
MYAVFLDPDCSVTSDFRGHNAPKRPCFWVLATDDEIKGHMSPLMPESSVKRYEDEQFLGSQGTDNECIEGYWPFFVPVPTHAEDGPIFMFQVFPYSGMNHQKDRYLPVPGRERFGDHPWLVGVEIKSLSELADLMPQFGELYPKGLTRLEVTR